MGAYLNGGRWNPPDLVATIYLAEPLDACIAEFHRLAQGQAQGPSSLLPRVLHTIDVEELQVLDLSTQEAREEVGLTLADIADDDRAKCQAVGEAAHFLGVQGIRAPSATGTGFVIAVFEPHTHPNQLHLVETAALAPRI